MDIEKLIEQLNDWNEKYISNLCGDRTIKCEEYCIKDDCLIVKAATALSTLQAENSRLRADLEYEREHANAYYEECGQWEAENEKLRTELERMKKIMRDNGIMTIPPKYPGGPTEWNIPKPRSQKED